jgi:hypothetical protein
MDRRKKMVQLKKRMCELVYIVCNPMNKMKELESSIEKDVNKYKSDIVEPEIAELKKVYKNAVERMITKGYEKTLTDALNEIYTTITSDVVVFEDSRYLLTTRDMQKIKEAHYGKPTWVFVYPIYKNIFDDLYVDIHPDTSTLSNGDLENVSYSSVNCKTVRRKNEFNTTRKKWFDYIKNATGL